MLTIKSLFTGLKKSAELGDVRSAYQVGYALRVSSLAVVVRYKSSEHSYFAA